MKISVNLDVNSIKQAIQKLKKAKQQVSTTMLAELLEQSCYQIMELANDRLKLSYIGYLAQQQIMAGWRIIKPTVDTIVLENVEDKAVYVEFGVGRIGQSKSHPLSKLDNYQYDVPSDSKTAQGQWVFAIDDRAEIDLQDGNGNYVVVDSKDEEFMYVITKGSPATMYLYNACMDFVDRNDAKLIWQKIKMKYWG